MTDRAPIDDPDDRPPPLGSWRNLYLVVFGQFVLVVIGLAWFTWATS